MVLNTDLLNANSQILLLWSGANHLTEVTLSRVALSTGALPSTLQAVVPYMVSVTPCCSWPRCVLLSPFCR